MLSITQQLVPPVRVLFWSKMSYRSSSGIYGQLVINAIGKLRYNWATRLCLWWKRGLLSRCLSWKGLWSGRLHFGAPVAGMLILSYGEGIIGLWLSSTIVTQFFRPTTTDSAFRFVLYNMSVVLRSHLYASESCLFRNWGYFVMMLSRFRRPVVPD